LSAYAQLRGRTDHQLPPPSNKTSFNVMDCSRLKSLGWVPRGVLDLDGLVDPLAQSRIDTNETESTAKS
ncbi:MAG: hypothetical protein AAGF25_14825, partial [Pseudomonadota bacterium]